jgi:FKBP-type peptidyl-prolyl cis-trans isomerase
MRPTLPAALALLAAIAACGGGTTEPGADPLEVTYAPELGIDLAAMTRTSSGLFYQDVTVGAGAEVRAGNVVRVTYSGWLPNGTLFDSRTDPGNPLEFLLGAGVVIRGWDEGVAGMRVGGVRTFVIPPSLGYGSRAVGPIPANSVLVFRVGMVGVRS